MNVALFTLAVIIGFMLAEARLARRHDAQLRARGAIAPPGDVYALMAVLYPAAFVVMGLEGVFGPGRRPLFVSGVLLFAVSKALKYWAISALGERWSFRVFLVPGVALVKDGPYRYVAHPNYVAVAGELVSTAMMMGASVSGPIMCAVFGAVLWARVRFENRVLRRQE